MWLKLGFLMVILWLFSGCSTVGEIAKKGVFYKRDIKIKANGYQGVGVLVIPKATHIKAKLTTVGKADMFTMTSCHQEQAAEESGKRKGKLFGVFGRGRTEVEVEWSPDPDLETNQACPMNFGQFDLKGRHGWGLMEMEDDVHQLPALLSCNGSKYNTKGVSMCQSRMDLIQKIEFPEVVNYSPEPDCPLKLNRPTDGKKFVFVINKGTCVYLFQEKGPKARFHRLTTLGYEKILVRGGK